MTGTGLPAILLSRRLLSITESAFSMFVTRVFATKLKKKFLKMSEELCHVSQAKTSFLCTVTHVLAIVV